MTTRNTKRKPQKEKEEGRCGRGLVFYLRQRAGSAGKDKP